MSIHKHNGPRGIRYEVRYRGVNGSERSKRFRSRREAEAYEREQYVAMRRGVWSDPMAGRILISEWSAEWQSTLVHLAESTKRIHESNMRVHVVPDVKDANGKLLAEGLGQFELGKLTTAQVTQWVAAMMRKPRRGSSSSLSAASVHSAYRTLHRCLEAAVATGRLGRNPLDGVKPPRLEEVSMRFLEASEVSLLADTIDERYLALVLVGCLCGLRAGELIALRWENVDMLGRRIMVVEQADRDGDSGAVKPPKTAAGRRSVPMPQMVADALAAHAALIVRSGAQEGLGTPAAQALRLHLVTDARAGNQAASASGLVFRSANGGPIDLHNFRARTWASAVRTAGLEPLRIHDMRHTAASLAIKAGADVKVIQRMLGHASAAMTLDRYGHLMAGQAEAVAERLDVLMAGSR